ncbi:VapE domain-containing protein [Ampullimonas aquatilis]|uniref:VapE domain-containing protein n=1 Tax=Ampullimonas aquatilis TaxID=1341549 RepID=UPI003C72DED0
MATLSQVYDQMLAAGLPSPVPSDLLTTGTLIKFGKHKKCWYVFWSTIDKRGAEQISGQFGYFQGAEKYKFDVRTDWTTVSDEQRVATQRRQREYEAEQAAIAETKARNAANRARMQWGAALEVGNSDYLMRKQITPEGVRFFVDGTVLVPMCRYVRKANGVVRTIKGLQKIAPDGGKLFNKGMDKAGTAYVLGELGADTRLAILCEGYATGRSIRMALAEDPVSAAIPVIVAFDAGNLKPAAEQFRELYPQLNLLLAADDDCFLLERLLERLEKEFGLKGETIPLDGQQHTFTVKGGEVCVTAWMAADAQNIPYLVADVVGLGKSPRWQFENAGLSKAHQLASKLGLAAVVSPQFPVRTAGWTDFNDLHCGVGLAAVRANLLPALRLGEDLTYVLPAADALSAVDREVGKPLHPDWSAELAATPVNAGAETDDIPDYIDPHWRRNLTRTDKGVIQPTLANVFKILMCDESWSGVLGFDEFAECMVKTKLPPHAAPALGEWSDNDDLYTTIWLQNVYGFAPRDDLVGKAAVAVAQMHKFNSARDYFDGLVWDGKRRICAWTVTYLRAEYSMYHCRAGMKWLIAAVRRVYQPGCKADNVLILEGGQGAKKSTALKVLGGDWFTDSAFRLDDKDAYAIMRGKLIVELAELDSFNKADSNLAKRFFSGFEDTFRPPYGKRSVTVKRKCVFGGSVNHREFLKDETGNRRYWPIAVGNEIDLQALEADRDQLWAEAVHLHRKGVRHWVDRWEVPRFEWEQESRREPSAIEEDLANWLELNVKSSVTLAEILRDYMKLDHSKWAVAEKQVAKALKALKWQRKRLSKDAAQGRRPWAYVKVSDENLSTVATVREPGDDDEEF